MCAERTCDDWRRGVAFVRELVPRQAIAVVARTFYGEPYSALPMRHIVSSTGTVAFWRNINGAEAGAGKPWR